MGSNSDLLAYESQVGGLTNGEFDPPFLIFLASITFMKFEKEIMNHSITSEDLQRKFVIHLKNTGKLMMMHRFELINGIGKNNED